MSLLGGAIGASTAVRTDLSDTLLLDPERDGDTGPGPGEIGLADTQPGGAVGQPDSSIGSPGGGIAADGGIGVTVESTGPDVGPGISDIVATTAFQTVQTVSDSAAGPSAAAGATIVVSNAAELTAALAGAQSGDRIELAAGNYGDVRISPSGSFSGGVEIVSQTPGNPAVFDTLVIDHVSDVTLRNITVDFVPNQNTFNHDSAVRILGTSNIKMLGCTVKGGPAVNGVPPDTTTGLDSTGNVLGFPTGNGIMIQDSGGIMIRNTDISEFFAGIRMANVDGMNILNNSIHDLRSSPIGGGNVSNLRIDGNQAQNFTPWNFGGSGDHGDFIHLWTRAGFQSSASQNITITNNFFKQGTGSAILGFYLDDDGNGLGHDNVLIENNVIVNGDPQGIRFENVFNAVIRANTMLQSTGDPTRAPGILLTDNTRNTLVEDNITSFITTGGGPTGATAPWPYNTISNVNNLLVQKHYPDRPGYYDDLFTNAFAPDAGLADLLALPGSLIETLGVGAAATLFPSTPATPTGVMFDTAQDGISARVSDFDASLIFGPGGVIDTTGASVSWNFGDGRADAGLAVSHAFKTAGFYDVTATVTLAGGQKVTVSKTVLVHTPFLVKSHFKGGTADDISDAANTVNTSGAVSFLKDGGNFVAKLNGGAISYDPTPDMFDNTEYTMMVDFRKVAAGDTGMLINFPGSFTLAVNGDELVASITTSGGTQWLKARGLPINDAGWHSVALVFDNGPGTAKLYLDGQEVTRLTGLKGEIQYGNITHDLHIGNPWGTAFTGHIDNPLFLSGALKGMELRAFEHASKPGLVLKHLSSDLNARQAIDDIRLLGGGDNSVQGGPGDDILLGRAGDDTLDGGGGKDLLDGGWGRDQLWGRGGEDHLAGGYGVDDLRGGDGSDRLFGGQDDDRLYGGTGGDFLRGDQGNDVMTGGTGPDIYAMRDGSGQDRITDFETGTDMIGLRLHSGASRFADLSFTDKTGGVKVSFGADSVFLVGLSQADLSPGDFNF